MMKKQFYEQFDPIYQKNLESGTTIINKTKYDAIVEMLLNADDIKKAPKKSRPSNFSNYANRYYLGSNVESRQLYRQSTKTKVPVYEELFNIIHQQHINSGHQRYSRPQKQQIDQLWFGVTDECIKTYVALCPECLPSARVPKTEKINPLKMILSPTIGSRAQMDLIDLNRYRDGTYCWVLRYIDHHSGFGYVAPLTSKSSLEVGHELIRILGTAVMPEILQSDNGTEFLGECLVLLKKYYNNIRIVKGRPYHPQSQGAVERGNSPFKEALFKWIRNKNNTGVSWAKIGIYVINAQINNQKSESKNFKSPYEAIYGKVNVPQSTYVLDEKILGLATTEYAVQAVEQFINLVSRSDSSKQIPVEMLHEIIQKADSLYETVVRMEEEGEEQAAIDFNAEKKIKMLVESYTSLLVGDMKPSSIEETPNSTAISELNIDEMEKHPKRVVPSLDDSPSRKNIRQEIYDAKVKQADKVNSAIRKKLDGIKKDPLEVNDICTLLLPPYIKSVTRHVPVMVTEVVTLKGNKQKHKLCMKDGHIQGTYSREQLYHRASFSADLLEINTDAEGFKVNLKLQDVAREFNNFIGCECKTNCATATRCSCRSAGLYCTTKCHGGRASNKKCMLTTPDSPYCAEVNAENEKEQKASL
jgi:hypothetical protein